MPFTENIILQHDFKINNIKKFLAERQNLNEINDNFLSIFAASGGLG